MVVTDYNEQFLDKRGTDHLIDELKAYIDSIATGDIDLSNYVTKSELQAKLDALDINIDLSSYATKEELTNAINSIDLSAYALKTEIPSLDGYATTEYVDNAIANVPSGGNVDLSNYYTKAETNALIPSLEGYATEQYVSTAINSIPATDLSNYYTKEETYSKTEVDIKVAEAGGSSVPILSMEDWIELNTQYDENINFCNKMVYFDTSIAFKDLLKDKTYRFFLYDENGTSMKHHNYVMYENGVLKITHSNKTNNRVSSKTSLLYDKTQSNGEWSSADSTYYGNWVNGWQTLSEDIVRDNNVNNVCLWGNVLQLGNGISSPNFSYKDMEIDAYDIDGKELYYALLKSIIKIVDENGNEITFKTVPTKEDYLEYVNNLSGGGTTDLSNYYTKDETYSKDETYNKTEVNTLIANSGGSGGGGSSSGGITYAFNTEIATGETWVDGRPIYMKVLDFTNVKPTSISGYNLRMVRYDDWLINEVIDSRLIFRNGTSNFTFTSPTADLASNTTIAKVIADANTKIVQSGMYINVINNENNSIIQTYIGTHWNNVKKIYVTVKYTKP